ncbi:MAG: haloacid dehalogenase type II [Proteobacteria bacterium]|nr:haloacid dehalogenase type II [Pseudomonadota bacterium]
MAGGIRACVFDAYGTLFDVHSAVRAHGAAIGPKADDVSRLWRTKQLEYSWVRSLMGRHADFRQLTAEALTYAFEFYSIDNNVLYDNLMKSYQMLACYSEVPAMLGALRARGLRTAILSNGTPDWLARAIEAAGIGALLDAVWSVESVGIFKPDARVYRLATHGLGLAADDIGFVSSNPWDAAGAAANGFRAVWVNRTGVPGEYASVADVPELADLAALVGHFGLE